MSDYLTRLVERSLGLAPRIEPLIASLNAPSDQMLREKEETSAPFESSPAVRIETSQLDSPPGIAVSARDVETDSQAGSQLPPASRPPSELRAEFSSEKRENRVNPADSRPGVLSQPTPSAPLAEAVDIAPALPPAPPPSPRTTPITSQGTRQNIVQPEIIEYLKPGASPKESRDNNQLVVRPEIVQPEISEHVEAAASPKESPLPPGMTTTASKKTTQSVVPPEVISLLKPAASQDLVPALQSSATEPPLLPSITTTASKKATQSVAQPQIISPLKPAASRPLPERPTSPNEPPAIHVTIGRVEVRAIMPHAVTPKVASPAAPKLSLKEYLRQRKSA